MFESRIRGEPERQRLNEKVLPLFSCTGTAEYLKCHYISPQVWFQNRRAKYRKQEHTKKGPGRPAHNAYLKSCSGEPMTAQEIKAKEKVRQDKRKKKAEKRILQWVGSNNADVLIIPSSHTAVSTPSSTALPSSSSTNNISYKSKLTPHLVIAGCPESPTPARSQKDSASEG